MANHGYDFTTYQVDSRHGAVVRRCRGRTPGGTPTPSRRPRQRSRSTNGPVTGCTPFWETRSPNGWVVASTGRMHERAAPTFMIGRVVLAGQAAHVANPLTAFWTTGEFLDAFMLADALAKVVGAPATTSASSMGTPSRAGEHSWSSPPPGARIGSTWSSRSTIPKSSRPSSSRTGRPWRPRRHSGRSCSASGSLTTDRPSPWAQRAPARSIATSTSMSS